jgi:hypothetical protein
MADYLTLADYSKFMEQKGAYLQSGIVDILRRESFLLDKMQFPNVGALVAHGTRTKTLPTSQNRKLNEHYTHSIGSVEPLEETAMLFGGRVDLDHQLEGGKGLIQDPGAYAVKMYATAKAYHWNYDVINNDEDTNADSIVGLRYRLLNDLPSTQKIDGAGVDISPDNSDDSAHFNQFYDYIQAAIHACKDHSCDLMLTNDTMKLRIESGLRRLKLYASTKDSFGRTVATWGEGGPAIIDMGTAADQSTKVFPDTEAATGALTGATFTSIMFVKLGIDFFTGWQKKGMDIFRWQEGVIKHIEMDWAAGIFITDPRSISWLYDVQAA